MTELAEIAKLLYRDYEQHSSVELIAIFTIQIVV